MATVYLGLGTNLGDRVASLRAALARLRSLGRLGLVSGVYETEPWGVVDQPRFLNLCCVLDTPLAPGPLLRELKAIERALGRTPTRPWGPRVIDIDLLGYEDTVLSEPGLTLPHPGIAERAFVLVPLAEIAPTWVVPGTGQTVAALLDRIPEAPALAWRVGDADTPGTVVEPPAAAARSAAPNGAPAG